MRRGASILLVLLVASALGGILADAESQASVQSRSVDRLVGYPTPYGPVTVLDDGHAWEVDVPLGAQVFVHAQGAPGSLFYLRWRGSDAPDPPLLAAPAPEDVATLGAGAWRVTVDPAGGVAVHVDVTFTGTYGDVTGGTPAPFTLRDLGGGSPCVVPGACLP